MIADQVSLFVAILDAILVCVTLTKSLLVIPCNSDFLFLMIVLRHAYCLCGCFVHSLYAYMTDSERLSLKESKKLFVRWSLFSVSTIMSR